ncbi:MAG: amidase family protein, partial [bacterium]
MSERMRIGIPLAKRIGATLALVVLPITTVTGQARTAHRAAAPAGIDVTEASITELQRAMTDGRTTSARLVDAYLARIAAYDHAGPAINAMIRLNPRAHEEAVALDAARRAGHVRGPLHGIPIILKDNYDTKDEITSAGSLALATHQP